MQYCRYLCFFNSKTIVNLGILSADEVLLIYFSLEFYSQCQICELCINQLGLNRLYIQLNYPIKAGMRFRKIVKLAVRHISDQHPANAIILSIVENIIAHSSARS